MGPGYVWLAGAVTLLFGVLGAAAAGDAVAWVATGAAVVATLGRNRPIAAGGFLAAGVLYWAAAWDLGDDALLAFTGALALGGITSEMMLGHWYLVSPQLPRWALRRLAFAGGVGVVVDSAAVIGRGALDFADDAIISWAFLLLATTTLILVVAVWFSLNTPSYSGVMAATGLSYLAVLTVIGAVVAGRSLLDEAGSLLAGTLPGP